MLRRIRRAFTAAALISGIALAIPALAGPVALTSADPVAIITVPDAWSSSKIARGLEIKTPDDEVYVWFELALPAEMPTVQKEHDVYFEKEGVKVTGSSETVKSEVKGRAWSFTELQATSKDGPSIIRYVAINPNVASGKIILMTYWASPGGHKIHDADMSKLISSIDFK